MSLQVTCLQYDSMLLTYAYDAAAMLEKCETVRRPCRA